MGRVGADFAHGSGDYAIAFSVGEGTNIPDSQLDPLFIAVQDAVEEAILNSLFMAETTVGYAGHVRYAVPLVYVVEKCEQRGLTLKKPDGLYIERLSRSRNTSLANQVIVLECARRQGTSDFAKGTSLMRRWITVLLLGLLLGSGISPAIAQSEIDFDEVEGIERAVGRLYLGPITVTESMTTTEYNDAGTPIAEYGAEWAPVGTPDPASVRGTVQLSVSVMEFDAARNANSAVDLFDQSLQESMRRDPRSPELRDISLDGLGDRALGYTGEQSQGDVTSVWGFAVVQDDTFVYGFTGHFVGLNAIEQVEQIVQAMIDADAEPSGGQFREDGTSSGGLWEKLSLVEPVLVEGSTVIDSIIYPPSAIASPRAEDEPDIPRVDLDNPATIAGIESLYARTWQLEGREITPDLSDRGVFRINAWILAFDSPQRAADAEWRLSNTLIEGIGVFSSEGGATANDDGTMTSLTINKGFIQDQSLPPGNAVVHIVQESQTVYAAVVYAIDDDPLPIAEAILTQMVETPASDEPEIIGMDSMSRGGVWERFPEEGDTVLEGLVPVSDTSPNTPITVGATPAATPAP